MVPKDWGYRARYPLLCTFCTTSNAAGVHSWGCNLPLHKPIGDIMMREPKVYINEEEGTEMSESLAAKYPEFAQDVALFAINILMWMTSEIDRGSSTDLVSAPPIEREAKPSKGRDALWGAKWLGRNYRIHSEGGDGHHASPRAHWRRGHMRHQAHGKGLLLRKWLFIDPILVNAHE